MRLVLRAARPLEPGPSELCSCPDTHDRGVAWSWSVSGIVGAHGIEEVLVSDDDEHVDVVSERFDLAGETLMLQPGPGEEVVLVVMRHGVELAEGAWQAHLAAGDVLVSDGEQSRCLEVRSEQDAVIQVVRLRWRDARPMRWVP